MLPPAIRSFAKSCAVLLLGHETRPRKIVRGLASGYRIRVSPVDHLGYLLGASEPHPQRIIRQYVAAGDTVYDIGAYIGYASLFLAKLVGPGGQVIAFEPVPKNVQYFRESMPINHLTSVRDEFSMLAHSAHVDPARWLPWETLRLVTVELQ